MHKIVGQFFEKSYKKKVRNPTSMETKERTQIENDVCEETVRSVFENPLPMKSILNQLECFDIQRLRTVNSAIRKCIDTLKPNPRIEKYEILFNFTDNWNQIDVYVELESGEFKGSTYTTCESSFFINYEYFPAQSREELCLNDFEATLRYQMSCMEELTIAYEYIERSSYIFGGKDNPYEELSKKTGEILKRRAHPLKTRKISMGMRQTEMLGHISAVDSSFLKTIELFLPFDTFWIRYHDIKELPIEVDQLSQTDQWKNAEQLFSTLLAITTPIQKMNVLHFSVLEILVETISSQDVDYLKTNLLKSTTFQKFKISFRETTIDESLHTLIGEPYSNFSSLKKVWYFQIQNTDYYIQIDLDIRDVRNIERNLIPKVIIFTRVPKEDAPFVELPINQLMIN
ncbi:hypothetical protein B9Z55_021238 [Caenorhabditis nigoni]|uniref:DUF38 domain-containing protein n=1 Tax=Caenorhabditis nigoni TaxID=1611254 RepID=A0A2G5TRZ3_9PELO|nr:hypothetical protein B9Z55_021238 [Caenorhabditis nigoni]